MIIYSAIDIKKTQALTMLTRTDINHPLQITLWDTLINSTTYKYKCKNQDLIYLKNMKCTNLLNLTKILNEQTEHRRNILTAY